MAEQACDNPSMIMQPVDFSDKEVHVSDDESLKLVTRLPRYRSLCGKCCEGNRPCLRCISQSAVDVNANGYRMSSLYVARANVSKRIIHCSQGFQITMLFPMLVFMVEAYGVSGTQGRATGFYAGLLASLFPLAQFCSSIFWGMISDRTGRRPWLAFGNAVSALSSLLLGLSGTYSSACVVRFMGGLLNGSMTITKSTMAELCDGTNQAKGFGILNLAWGIGAIAGPVISGLLAQPCKQYQYENCPLFLQRHPFFLPCVSATIFSSIAVVAAIYLKETNSYVSAKRQPYRKIPPPNLHTGSPGTSSTQQHETIDSETQVSEMKSFQNTSFDEQMMDINLGKSSSNQSTKQKLIVIISSIEESRKGDIGDSAATLHVNTPPTDSIEEEARQPTNSGSKSTLDLLRDRDVLLSSFCYSMTGLVFIITDELFPIYGATAQADGGLGFSSSKLGIVLGEAGLVLFLYTLVLYPIVAKRLGPLYCFRYGILGSIPCWILFPTCSILSGQPVIQWLLLMFTMAVRSAVACTAFTGILILVSNSASSDNLGTVTGLSHSFCSFFRAIGPALGGVIWSFASTKTFPFHQFLAWQFVVLLCLCTFGLSYKLPATLVRPKDNR